MQESRDERGMWFQKVKGQNVPIRAYLQNIPELKKDKILFKEPRLLWKTNGTKECGGRRFEKLLAVLVRWNFDPKNTDLVA